jgi:hypothetical protein
VGTMVIREASDRFLAATALAGKSPVILLCTGLGSKITVENPAIAALPTMKPLNPLTLAGEIPANWRKAVQKGELAGVIGVIHKESS